MLKPAKFTLPKKLEKPKEIHPSRLEFMNIGQKYWQASFDSLNEAQREAVGSYLDNMFVAIQKGMGLFLWGPNSTGKSYISAVLCKRAYALYDVPSYCVTSAELRDAWIHPEEARAQDDTEELLLNRAMGIRFLVIDDLGKEHRTASGYVSTQLGVLLRHRVRQGFTTVITANAHPSNMVSEYGQSTIELMKESMVPVPLEGPDMRAEAASAMASLLGY